MLKRWSVEGFKSIGDRVNIDFSPLTVFVGANSSGKSTILQSILLLKQTVQYAPTNRPLTLNGPILKLGRFDDVLHTNLHNNQITFGYCLDLSPKPKTKSSYNLAYHWPSTGIELESFDKLTFEAGFSVDDPLSELSQLQPKLNFSSVSLQPQAEQYADIIEVEDGFFEEVFKEHQAANTSVTIHSTSGKSDGSDEDNINFADIPATSRHQYSVGNLSNELEQDIIEGLASPKIVSADTVHFMPSKFTVEFNASITEANIIVDDICTLSTSHRSRSRAQQAQIPGTIVTDILNYLSQQVSFDDLFNSSNAPLRVQIDDQRKFTSREVVKLILDQFLPDAPRGFARVQPTPQLGTILSNNNVPYRKLRSALQDLAPALINMLTEHNINRLEHISKRPSILREAAAYSNRFFARSIKYLGPLRDDPKPLYPLEALVNPLDIGYRGEHTAAVLELNRDRLVEYIHPEAIENGKIPEFTDSDTLHDAAQRWLSYLGVAEDVSTSDKGKFGHEMQVKTKGVNKTHDLTNVGVGVSQVLPIIIMSLLSEDGSILIFEQPELHLHPLVQARLSDFFIAISLQGKQCIIESHSEYLIKRLRRRTAEFSDETLTDISKIYFVERNNGVSSYKPISLNAFGNVSEWPKDFFDQSDKETEQIIKAATFKKLKNRKK